MKKITISLVMILLSGCAASGPTFSDAPKLSNSSSGVYVYRNSKHFLTSIGATTIYVDGKPFGQLSDAGYLFKQLSPGQHSVGIKNRTSLFSSVITPTYFNIQSGHIRYIKAIWGPTGGAHVIVSVGAVNSAAVLPDMAWGLQSIPEPIAKTEIKALHYSGR